MRIGDKVKIVDEDAIYTTYREKFEELGFKNTDVNDSTINSIVQTYEIFAKGQHGTYDTKLYAIRSTTTHEEFLISEDGIELVPVEQLNNGWLPILENTLPDLNTEVLFFHKDWIHEDFNPKGIRIGFRDDDGLVTANWLNEYDHYDTVMSEINIIPTHWKPLGDSPIL